MLHRDRVLKWWSELSEEPSNADTGVGVNVIMLDATESLASLFRCPLLSKVKNIKIKKTQKYSPATNN